MTDSVHIKLNLESMPTSARKTVPLRSAQESDQYRTLIGQPYAKLVKAVSPLTGTGMPFKTHWEESGKQRLATHITARMNIPNALVGHNFEHGTSVFAAGVAGLELLRIALVSEGVPADALAGLTTEHVSFYSVTITYLIVCASEREADELARRLDHNAKIFFGRPKRPNESTNVTAYIEQRDFCLGAYNKTDFSHCAVEDELLKQELESRARKIVRIEVTLKGEYLREKGWGSLESWRDAYSEGRYEAIFNLMVRKSFRLDRPLRHKRPRAEVLARLTPTERYVLSGYLNGKDVSKFSGIARGANSVARSKLLYKWRKSIFGKTDIDIAIPWAKHKTLRSFELERGIRYPGDHFPLPDVNARCFCKKSWPAWLDWLKQTFREMAAVSCLDARGASDE